MPDVGTKETVCSLCGREYRHAYLSGCTEITLPDTDLRPAMVKRMTMDLWTHTCPFCGFIERDVPLSLNDDQRQRIRELMRTSAYKAYDRDVPETAAVFAREGILREASDDPMAYESFLHAAWVCDDAETEHSAKTFRLRALRMIEERPELLQKKKVILQYTDMLRRTGSFAEVLAFCASIHTDDTAVRAVLDLQEDLARKEIGTGGYTLCDAGIYSFEIFDS